MLDFLKGTVTPKDMMFAGGIVAVAVALLAAFYFLVYTNQQNEYAESERKLDEVNQELKQAKERQANIEDLRTESKKMKQLVAQFAKRLPEKREIPRLLNQFEVQGNALGLSVKLNSLPPQTDARKETIPNKVTAIGSFHQIVSFINLLECDERYLKISDLNIGEEEAGVATATFKLSTFRFIQASPATAGEKKKPS